MLLKLIDDVTEAYGGLHKWMHLSIFINEHDDNKRRREKVIFHVIEKR